MSQVALTIAVAWFGFAQAIQPIEAGLQPLLDRQKAIQHEQQQLNQLLQSTATKPEIRADAYREYTRIELERQELECDIKRARSWVVSPLMMYAMPETGVSCRAALG